jgi:putative selenate reductase
MAQNLLLSYAAGGRVMELKTVQVNDRLVIGRPCIDANNVGYNIEWSQELLVDQSLREYVAGSMLIEMFRHGHNLLGDGTQVIYDMSIGYDLAGIRGEKVQRFIDSMRDASKIVDDLRSRIPRQFTAARQLDYPASLSQSVTLSTFHGCPANEIERICQCSGRSDWSIFCMTCSATPN